MMLTHNTTYPEKFPFTATYILLRKISKFHFMWLAEKGWCQVMDTGCERVKILKQIPDILYLQPMLHLKSKVTKEIIIMAVRIRLLTKRQEIFFFFNFHYLGMFSSSFLRGELLMLTSCSETKQTSGGKFCVHV